MRGQCGDWHLQAGAPQMPPLLCFLDKGPTHPPSNVLGFKVSGVS